MKFIARGLAFLNSLPERVYAKCMTTPDGRWIAVFSAAWKEALGWHAYLLRFRIKHLLRWLFHRPPNTKRPVRIAFVIPWYGRTISGGAEAEAYGLIHALRRYAPDLQVEVLTTTLKEFAADWNSPVHEEGVHVEEGIPVHRFHPSCPDRELFHLINGEYLMHGGTEALWDERQQRAISPLPGSWAEIYFLRRMVMSAGLLAYMDRHHEAYDAFVLMPYLFAPTALGTVVAGRKAMVIPCLHDERYAYMTVFGNVFKRAGAVLCHVRSEAALFKKLYPQAPEPVLIGEQVNTEAQQGDPERFRATYQISGPFILYAGRQVIGKNLPLLVTYFKAFQTRHPEWADLKLVLIGKGDLDYTDEPGIVSLGFIPADDKMDAYAAATACAMLSINESFSIVIMEAWLQKTPVLVSADCAVTRDHVADSDGGYAVSDESSFAHALSALLSDHKHRDQMGSKGRAYVLEHYTAEKVTQHFCEALSTLTKRACGPAYRLTPEPRSSTLPE